MAQVNAVEALIRGARSEFVDTYANMIKGSDEKLKKVMDLGLPSDKASEIYPYFESSPNAKRWPRGEPIPTAGFTSKSFLVPNYDWAIAIDWHENDEQDDQTRSLVTRARDAATKLALLPERIFFQLLTAGTDGDLLPTVPNAPDGSAFFATTSGSGANRFGVANGNLLTGSGVATTAAIQTDFWAAIAQFVRFLDTDSQPLWPAELISRGVTIIYGAANNQVFAQAFQQNFVQATNAATSNVVLDADMKVTLWQTPRITDNDWFVFLNAAPTRACFQQVRQPVRDNMEDMLNSDHSRRTTNKRLHWDAVSASALRFRSRLSRSTSRIEPDAGCASVRFSNTLITSWRTIQVSSAGVAIQSLSQLRRSDTMCNNAAGPAHNVSLGGLPVTRVRLVPTVLKPANWECPRTKR